MCKCPEPALCLEFGRHLNGRLYELAKGINCTPAQSEAYKRLWLRQGAAARLRFGVNELNKRYAERKCCGK